MEYKVGDNAIIANSVHLCKKLERTASGEEYSTIFPHES